MGEQAAIADETGKSRRAALVLIGFAILLGIVLRSRQYAAQHSYWSDEAMLVLNVFDKSASELLGPLSSAQAAPPAFLLAERGMYNLFGRRELGMRLVPFVAGLVCLGLFAAFAWRIFGDRAPFAAVFVVTLFACSDRLIWHSAEAKQYTTDVLFGLIYLLIALPKNPAAFTPSRMLLLGIVAAVGIWCSHITVFMFGGISLAMLPRMVREFRRRGVTMWVIANTLFMVSFVLVYFVSIHNQEVPSLFNYWKDEFVDYSRPLYFPVWFVRELASFCNYPLDLGGPILFPVVILGCWMLYRGGERVMLAVFLLPVLLIFLAAALHRYPFGGSRLTVFTAAGMLVLAGMGLIELARIATPRLGPAWMVIPVYLVGVAGFHAVVYLSGTSARGNTKPVVQYISSHWRTGDVIYSNKPAEFRCYWPDAPLRPASELSKGIPDGRFWLALSYVERNRKESLEKRHIGFEVQADRKETFTVPGGTATLFDGPPDIPVTLPADAPTTSSR